MLQRTVPESPLNITTHASQNSERFLRVTGQGARTYRLVKILTPSCRALLTAVLRGRHRRKTSTVFLEWWPISTLKMMNSLTLNYCPKKQDTQAVLPTVFWRPSPLSFNLSHLGGVGFCRVSPNTLCLWKRNSVVSLKAT